MAYQRWVSSFHLFIRSILDTCLCILCFQSVHRRGVYCLPFIHQQPMIPCVIRHVVPCHGLFGHILVLLLCALGVSFQTLLFSFNFALFSTMEAEVKENSENVAPSTEQSLLKQAEEIKEEKSSETEAVSGNQQQQKAEKDEQTSAGGGDGETRQVRIRKQVQRFSETMSKRYADEQAAKEKAHDAVAAQFGKGSGTPLSEIPLIEASIRGCKPMDLKTLHYACFGRVGGVAEVRSNLRKFSGFSFGRDSEEYGKRVQALNR